MPFFKEGTVLEQYTRKIFAAYSSQKEYIYAGIQVNIGAGLASYTFHTYQEHRVLPYLFSAVAIGGTYQVLKITRNDPEPIIFLKKPRMWSWWDLANGIFTFTTSVYAFSEGLSCNDRMWIPCLLLAASGLYIASTTVATLDMFLNRRPFMKCCQLMFEPALVACASTYLFHFRGHNQWWLKCLPFLVIGKAGYIIVDRGSRRDGCVGGSRHLLLKVIEMFFGGCYLSISCAVLAIYSSANDFSWHWTVFISLVSLYGMFVIFGSILCLRVYLRMNPRLFFPTVGMFVGPLIFSSGFVMMECLEECYAKYIGFLFLIGTGQLILYRSLNKLYKQLPRVLLLKFYQAKFGPLLTMYSSAITAYTAYRLGWRFCLLPMPFIPVGMYATYRGFRKER